MSKLFALCDRGIDLQDCLALGATEAELQAALPWLKEQDSNIGWPAHVDEVIEDLRGRLRDGV